MHFGSVRIGVIAEPEALVPAARRRHHDRVSDVAGHIHLVLPDPTERAACFRLLARAGRVVRSFASADAWLEAAGDTAGGVLLFHWHQPGRVDGAALLSSVAARSDLSVFVAAERLDIAETRAILRGGTRDLLPAPLDPQAVRRVLDDALDDWRAARAQAAFCREAEQRLAALTPRERDILDGIAAGMGNKAIARRLALSPRTVEVHRANIMRRSGADSVAELLRLRFIAEQIPAEPVRSVHFGA